MSREKKKAEVEIIEGSPADWGEDFAIIMHFDRPSCPKCRSLSVQQLGELRWMCCACRSVWSEETP